MIPGFRYYFYPCLASLADGQEHKFEDIKKYSAEYLQLSILDLKEKLSSGSYRHNDRCSWALNYLKKSHLLDFEERKYKITTRGIDVLTEFGQNFDLAVVRDLDGFANFQKKEGTQRYWRPGHYTATGRYVPGYVSKWKYKGKQRSFATKEEAKEYIKSKKKKTRIKI